MSAVSPAPFAAGPPSTTIAPPAEQAYDEDILMDYDDSDLLPGAAPAPADSTEMQVEGSDDAEFEIRPDAIHVRGVDNLNTEAVKVYASEYFGEPITRIEWIDDTSLNIVYGSSAFASEALHALSSSTESIPPLTLREAKPVAAFPDSRIAIRVARISDRKERGARERSRYYLFHPEEDRLERRERERPRRDRRRERDDDSIYRRRYYDDREERDRRRADDYSENMYDDDFSGAGGKDKEPRRRRRSDRSRSPGFGRRRGDRSRSPVHRGDHWSRSRSRGARRSRSPRREPRELFPGDRPRSSNGPPKELFPSSATPAAPDSKMAFEALPSRPTHRPVAAEDRWQKAPSAFAAPPTAPRAVRELRAALTSNADLFPSSNNTNTAPRELFSSSSSSSSNDTPRELFASGPAQHQEPRELFFAGTAAAEEEKKKTLFDYFPETKKSLFDRIQEPETTGLKIKGASQANGGGFAEMMRAGKGEGLEGGNGSRRGRRRRAEELFG